MRRLLLVVLLVACGDTPEAEMRPEAATPAPIASDSVTPATQTPSASTSTSADVRPAAPRVEEPAVVEPTDSSAPEEDWEWPSC